MNTYFGFEFSVSKGTFHLQRCRLDACYITRLIIYLRNFITALLAPHDIHPVEHIRPVLAFRTSSSRVDFNNRAQLILLLAEHLFELEFLYRFCRSFIFTVKLLLSHVAGLMKFV